MKLDSDEPGGLRRRAPLPATARLTPKLGLARLPRAARTNPTEWSDYLLPETGIRRGIGTRRRAGPGAIAGTVLPAPPATPIASVSIVRPFGEEGGLYQLRIPAVGERPWLRDLKERWNVALNVQHVQPSGSPPSRLVAWIEAVFDPADAPAIRAFLESRPPEDNVRVSVTREDRMMVYMTCPLPPAFSSILVQGGLCEFAPALVNGPAESPDCWGFIVPRESETVNLTTSSSRSPGFRGGRGSRVGGVRPRGGVSYRQELALRTAFRLGYFENPRRADLREVGAAIGVSPHATMELLRRGVRELVSERQGGRYA